MESPSLLSFETGYRALVFGGSGGIGGALVRALARDPRCASVQSASRSGADGNIRFGLEDEASIAAAVAKATASGPLDLVIVATGLLHDRVQRPEKSWGALDGAALERSFRINAIGPALIAKHVLDTLPRDRKSVFAALSARVGSISDNRLGGWHGYRASKAALNMLVRNFALELERRNPRGICVALHPGTVDTELSKPFQANARTLFTPDHSAAALLRVIDGLAPSDSGKLLAWDGSEIPF